MNRKILKVTQMLMVAGIIAILAACGKDNVKDNNNELPANVKELLVERKWQVVSMVPDKDVDIDGNGTIDKDFQLLAEDCEKDDYTVYTGDGLVFFEEGSKVCDETPDPETRWELVNKSSLKISQATESYVLTIKSISADKLVLVQSIDVWGTSVKITITFKKI